jgi:hypothetical protein
LSFGYKLSIIHSVLAFRITLLFLALVSSSFVEASAVKIMKVLPHYLDLEGRHSVSPSLYDRDAYQAYLRATPAQRSALRFDIQWKGKGIDPSNLKLRMELRTSAGPLDKPLIVERSIKRSGWFSTWSALVISGEDYQKMGEFIAWRVTLWKGDQLLAEQKSFLW